MLVNSIFPFPTMFSTLSKTNFNFWVTFILLSVNALNSDQSKILSLNKEFSLIHTISLRLKSLENIVKKDKSCWLPAFSPLPAMFFFPIKKQSFLSKAIFNCFVWLCNGMKHLGKMTIYWVPAFSRSPKMFQRTFFSP